MSREVQLLTLPNGVSAKSFALKAITYNYYQGASTNATYVKGYGLPEYGYILGSFKSGGPTTDYPPMPTVASGTYVYGYATDRSPWAAGSVGTTTVTYYTVSTSPGTGGTMSGGGEFTSGSSCTITAKPNSGYIVTTLNGETQDGTTGNKSVDITVTGDVTVSATFKAYYSLQFNSNGGKLPSGAYGYPVCFADTEYTIPSWEPTRSGYKFIGWATTKAKADGRTVEYEAGDKYSRSGNVANSVVNMYAVWKQYTITYDASGGTSTPASQSYYGNTTISATATRSGYLFNGWSIGGSTYQPGDPYNLIEDVTATALWIGHKGITTSVSLPSAAPNQPTPLSVTISPASQDGGWDEGTAITATAPASGLGVEFEAWNVTGAEVQVITANPLFFTMPDLPVSLTATYKMKELAVTCAVDSAARAAGAVASGANTYITDAGGQQSPTGFQYGDTVIFHAPEPESGFTFAGWYDASGVQRSANINYTLMLTSDITLYARYAVTVTVTKDEENGSGTFSVNGATYQAVEIALPAELGQPLTIAASSADGSYFGGWEIDGQMSDLFREDSVTVTAAHVFTAVFVSEPVSVSVTCLSEKNDPQAEGSIGSLAVLGATGTGGVFSVDGFSEITLVPSPSSESGALPLFRVVEVITEGQTESYREVAAPYVVRVSNADRTFKALWGEKANFLITVSSEDEAKGIAYVGESPSVRSAMYAQDTQVAVTALPTNGHKFVGWYEGGQLVSSDARYVFVVLNEPRTLEARFEDDAFAICEWEGSDEPKTMEWTSKVYVTARPFDPVAARVDATGYPVDLTVRTYSSPDKANALPDRPHELTAANPFPIQSQDGRRLPRMRPERYVQITVKSSHEIDAVVVGTNMTEVN